MRKLVGWMVCSLFDWLRPTLNCGKILHSFPRTITAKFQDIKRKGNYRKPWSHKSWRDLFAFVLLNKKRTITFHSSPWSTGSIWCCIILLGKSSLIPNCKIILWTCELISASSVHNKSGWMEFKSFQSSR